MNNKFNYTNYIKLSFSVFFVFLFFIAKSQRISDTTISSGNWTDATIWKSGNVPTSTTNAVIAQDDTVTVNSTGNNCLTLTIDSAGVLKLISGDLSTSNSFFIEKGVFNMSGGTLNVANSSTNYIFRNNKGNFSFSGGTINIGGRFVQKGSDGTTSISGSGTINVLTSGDYNDVNPVFSVFRGTFSVSSTSTANIILKHVNTNNKYILRYNPSTSNFNGGVLTIENNSGYSSNHFIAKMKNDDVYKLKIDIGSGNNIYFYDTKNTVSNLELTSGEVTVDSGSFIKFTNSTIGADYNLTILSGGSAIFSNVPTTDGTTEAAIQQERGITKNDWHYISAPVNDTRSFSTIFSSILDATGDYLYRFDEDVDTGSWRVIYPDNNGFYSNSFTAARGYAIYINDAASASDSIITFKGKVRSSDVTINLTKTDGPNNGFNLIGNPYTSSIQANKTGGFLSENSTVLDNTYGAIYLWNQSTGDYDQISSASTRSYLAPTQGFMVRTAADGNTATFKTSMQKNKWDTIYKSNADTNWIQTSFKISNAGGLINKTQISFNSEMTDGLDPFYDAGKLKANNKISLYTLLVDDSNPDISFGIQALPLYTKYPVSVKLGFDIRNSGEYTLSLNSFNCNYDNSLFGKTEIKLEDKYLNKIVNLKNTCYTFFSEAGVFTDRFVLHFERDVSGEQELEINNSANRFLVYTRKDNSIVIKNTSKDEEANLRIKLFDIQGKSISSYNIGNLSPGESYILNNLNLNGGIFILKVSNNGFVNSYKVLLN